MKKIIVGLILCITTFNLAQAQSSGITFVPGLGETSTVWSGMSDQLYQDGFNFIENSIDYDGFYDGISTSASYASIPNGDVVVAHSQGGLLAREYSRQHGNNSFNALITVGTPNEGAPIINSALNGTASNIIARMVDKLLIGPYVALYAFLPNPIGAEVTSTVDGLLETGQNSLQAYLDNNFQNAPGVNDMKPGSSFLYTLNQNPNNTLPAARYAIYGAEYIHTPWHLVGSAFYSGPGNIEDPQGIQIHDKVESIYLSVTNSAFGIAELYRYLRDRARENFNFDDYWTYQDLYHKWVAVASAFNVGYRSLLIGDQEEWSAYVTHSLIFQYYYPDGLIKPDTVYAEDGILASKTAAPDFFSKNDGINRRLQALGVNHLEETAHPKVKLRLEQIFQNSDVDITTGGGEPLSVAVSGVPYVNSGQTATFSSGVSNADGPVSYQWYYRPVAGSPWYTGGTSSTYQHTFYGPPGGGTAQAAVKIEVSSAGETASDIHSITVYGCQNSSLRANSVGTNIIQPCN